MKTSFQDYQPATQVKCAFRQKSSKNFTAQNPATALALALLALLAGSARRAAHSSLAATALALAGASGGGVGKELADKLAGLRGAVWTSKNARVVGTRVDS